MGKLNDDELTGVSGGAIFDARNINGSDKDKPFEVIDDRGNAIDRFANEGDARKFAREKGLGEYSIDWNEVMKRRS